jgi:catechol 2,3-dioxygenase-like lactoylglutathione lyase family enzyme
LQRTVVFVGILLFLERIIMSLDYVMIGTNDLVRARAFYDAVFPAIGGRLEHDYAPYTFCYAFRNDTRAWVAGPQNKEAAVPGNGNMPGFRCGSEDEVNAAHAAALASGGSNEGDPGPRPMYGPDFYGAYVRDPDGNKMSFIYHRLPADG